MMWKPTATVVLTKKLFDRAVSANGGFSNAQLALLGIEGRPTKGWKKQLLGTRVTQEVADKIVALKNEHLKHRTPNVDPITQQFNQMFGPEGADPPSMEQNGRS